MNKLLVYGILAINLLGCTATKMPSTSGFIKSAVQKPDPTLPNEIFTVVGELIDPIPMIGFGGELIRQNGCILFKTEENELATPIFIAKFTKYNPQTGEILYFNEPLLFNQKIIVGGGGISKTDPKATFANKAPSHCLLDKSIGIIGATNPLRD